MDTTFCKSLDSERRDDDVRNEDASVRNAPPAKVAASAQGILDSMDELLSAASKLSCEDSFRRLYDLSSARLLGIILRINRDRAEAEEVLQETFVKAWRQSRQFDPLRGRALYWLSGIAHNQAVSSLRRNKCRPLTTSTDLDGIDSVERLVCLQLRPDELMVQAQAVAAVQIGLATLSKSARQCLALALYDGLSHAEIAVHLGQPLGTVKSWMRRALVAMRPSLTGHH